MTPSGEGGGVIGSEVGEGGCMHGGSIRDLSSKASRATSTLIPLLLHMYIPQTSTCIQPHSPHDRV